MSFKAGEVWEYRSSAFLLLERIDDEYMTRYFEGEQKWKVFWLEEGSIIIARLHLETTSDSARWQKL